MLRSNKILINYLGRSAAADFRGNDEKEKNRTFYEIIKYRGPEIDVEEGRRRRYEHTG